YILLLIANELDLAYTYVGLSRGAFLEGNPWLGPLLLTWWPIAIKVICLAGLALGILVILEAGLPRQRRVLRALRVATAVYTAVLILHIVNLLTSLPRGKDGRRTEDKRSRRGGRIRTGDLTVPNATR